MTEHTPPTADDVAGAAVGAAMCFGRVQDGGGGCFSPRGGQPDEGPVQCQCFDIGTRVVAALRSAHLLPDENGISHTEPAALPETPSAGQVFSPPTEPITLTPEQRATIDLMNAHPEVTGAQWLALGGLAVESEPSTDARLIGIIELWGFVIHNLDTSWQRETPPEPPWPWDYLGDGSALKAALANYGLLLAATAGVRPASQPKEA